MKWSGVEAPRVSLIVSIYNHRDHLEESIASALGQDFPLELILVDAGSSGDSLERWHRVADDRFTLLAYEKNPGRSTVRNEAAKFARAPWLCFFDSEIVFLPGALKGFVQALEGARGAEWAYCGIGYANSAGGEELGSFDLLHMLVENAAPDDLFAVRYDVFSEIGGYPVTRRAGGDYALKLRLTERSDPFFFDRVCAHRSRYRPGDKDGWEEKLEKTRREFRARVIEPASRPDIEERRQVIRSALFLNEAADDRRWSDVLRYGEYLASRNIRSFELDRQMARALCEEGRLNSAWEITMRWIENIVEGRHVLVGEALWAVNSSLKMALMCKDFEKVDLLMPLAESLHQVVPDRTLKRYISRGKLASGRGT